MSDSVPNHHGTAILLGETGILIRGRARSGKSALALSALCRAEILGLPARLVADDQVLLRAEGGRLLAEAPASLAGLMEVSGIGILRREAAERAEIHLLVDLGDPLDIERLPDRKTGEILGLRLPLVTLPARQASFGADILQTLAMAPQPPDFRWTALTKS